MFYFPQYYRRTFFTCPGHQFGSLFFFPRLGVGFKYVTDGFDYGGLKWKIQLKIIATAHNLLDKEDPTESPTDKNRGTVIKREVICAAASGTYKGIKIMYKYNNNDTLVYAIFLRTDIDNYPLKTNTHGSSDMKKKKPEKHIHTPITNTFYSWSFLVNILVLVQPQSFYNVIVFMDVNVCAAIIAFRNASSCAVYM